MKYLAIAFGTGLWGAAVMWAMLPLRPEAPLLLAAAGGAFCAGLPCAWLFARPGLEWSALAAFVSTVAGAALGGAGYAMASPPLNALQGMALGITLVGASVLQSPLVLLTWLGGAVAVGWLAHRLAGVSP